MIITEYKDCLSLKYSDISEATIDRKTHKASVELDMLNGKKVEIDLALKKKKMGCTRSWSYFCRKTFLKKR